VVVRARPGHRIGTKYSCFVRLDGRFLFLPKPWRAIPRDPSEKEDPQ
jgi:hypothetical protein